VFFFHYLLYLSFVVFSLPFTADGFYTAHGTKG
jgi:hypothetical protein